MFDRIYVCHTFYHVYVSMLKEMAIPKETRGTAVMCLSMMSTDFKGLPERLKKSQFFADVVMFDERRDTDFPELMVLREEQGNIVKNMLARIKYTKKYAEIEERFIPVDFRDFRDIYVYCDSDPIGFYLNQNHIKYHAVEDGLNTIVNFDQAHYENRGHFKLKAFMSKKLNLIFVSNGYGKYCKDMEVNDISLIKIPSKYYVEVSRKELFNRLTKEDKEILLSVFVSDIEKLKSQIEDGKKYEKKILILTDPLCTLDVREQIFRDLIDEYKDEGQVFLKIHPRDVLDYAGIFPEIPQFEGQIPMEMLNFFPDLHFNKCIGVFTELKAIQFADECIRLGPDFMDKYETPEIHRQNEAI